MFDLLKWLQKARATACWRFRCRGLGVLMAAVIAAGAAVHAEDAKPWADKDSRLATEYLNLLVEKPEYGRVLELLWDLYDKHGATAFLLQNIAAQAVAQPHPSVLLVHAHLQRKSGDVAGAKVRYEEVLKMEPSNVIALRALADVADEQGDQGTAIRHLETLLGTYAAADARRVPLLLEQGKLWLATGKADDAALRWEQAVKIQPANEALTREVAQYMLGAGLADKALNLYRQLALQADPAKKLDALQDLSRLEEQADHFTQASDALKQGLALLHFRDWRYGQFFQRLVKVHERFGQLDALKAELLKAGDTSVPQEQAMSDLARFFQQTVDQEERVRWLRLLVKNFPRQQEHRWELVTELLDHDGAAEAAQLLDEVLKNDGTDSSSLILLRTLAHLRNGEPEQAVLRLRKLLETQGGNADIEKQVLAFARQKSLDEITEAVLKARVLRDGDRPEPVFDLAAFYRDRGKTGELDKLFAAFTDTPHPADKQRRLNDVSSFLASGTDVQSAEKAARLAVAQPGSGREELLRLGDVLLMRGTNVEALKVLEQAWALSDSSEKRTDVDDRIYSLLAGDQGAHTATPVEPTAEFKLPAFFTGEGFGMDAPPPAADDTVPAAVSDYALAQTLSVWGGDEDPVSFRALPEKVQNWLANGRKEQQAAAPNQARAPATPERIYRAAWWCWRADQSEIAYALMRRLIFDAEGRRIAASLDAEKLLLDLALSDRSVMNSMLAIRQLERLSDLDPGNRVSYQLRLAELEGKRPNERGLLKAIRILEPLVKEDPQNEGALSALSQFYLENDQKAESFALWEQSAKKAKGNATPLLERYAELLIAQRKYKEFVETQCQILETESDVKRRRDLFQRALDRLLWTEAQTGGDVSVRRGEVPEEDRKERLGLMAAALSERSQRNPFDGFWHEALAGIHEKQGDSAKAFAAMKQAYYTAPDTPFSLGQLRAAALSVGDLKSAIYFQKQIAAAPGAADAAGEWRQLVQLLEDDFRMKEADQARRRLESRFSQDPAALEDLAKYYASSAQEEAARRVYEQVARVRAWDAGNLLRLALQQKELGDLDAAEATLVKLLSGTPQPPAPDKVAPENLPWPLLDERAGTTSVIANVATSLENAPGLEQPERDVIRRFLSLPREEFSRVPTEAFQVRLRAVEELALLKALPKEIKLNPMEEMWAAYYDPAAGAAFRARLAAMLASQESLEARYVFVWLSVKSHGVPDVIRWVREPSQTKTSAEHRKGLLQAVVSILADDPRFEFLPADVVALGEGNLLSNTELIDIARKFESRRSYQLSAIMALAAQRNAPSLSADYALFLARLSEEAGDPAAQRKYLEQVWNKPLEAGRPDVFDPFVQSFTALWKLVQTSEERDTLLSRSLERLHQLPESGQGRLREARILGVVGASELSAKELADYMGNGLLSARAFAEPVMGRLPPGAPQAPRIDEVNHLRSYWDDMREWQELIKNDGLSRALVQVDQAVEQRNAGTFLGSRSSYEFGSWRNASLVRRFRFANYPERLLMLRQFVQPDETVDSLGELGGVLESSGFSRECIEIYRTLPDRAPSNTEYCEQLLRVCESSWECGLPIPYIEKILVAEPQLKPQGISDETLWEKHALFLARLQDTVRLRALAFRGNTNPKPLPGRVPEEVAYLKELALLLERQSDKPGALAAWEELHRLWTEDVEASLHRARLLQEQGNANRALEALREVPLTDLWNENARSAFVLRCRLAADAGMWDEVRDLMNIVAGGAAGVASSLHNAAVPQTSGGAGAGARTAPNVPQTASVLELSRVLVAHQRTVDAQSLLLRSERSVKDDTDRFRLRLEQLVLTAADPAWSPEKDSPRVAALLRLEMEQQEAMEALMAFLAKEATGPRVKSWVQVLTQPGFPRKPLTSLALSAMAASLDEKQAALLAAPWSEEEATNMAVRERTVRTLLKQGRPTWAADLCQSRNGRGLTESPVMIPVLAALGDRHRMEDFFAALVRMSFPGGGDCVAHAEALDQAGRGDLAGELYSLALQRVRNTGVSYPTLVMSCARHLIKTHRYEDAETLLLHNYDGIGEDFPPLLVELYRGWKKLDRLPQELVKFHLPDGLWQETVFLAKQAKPQS